MKTKIERERERGNHFCVGKLCIKWKREWEIYGKRMRIRRVKIKKDKRIEESNIKVKNSGETKGLKGREKC